MKYLIFGEEICPETGRVHYQTYVYFYHAKTFSAIKKFFPPGSHIEMTAGSPKQNMAYCAKDLKFEEFGERPSQGKRVDLQLLAERVTAGELVDSLALCEPSAYHVYGRTLNKLEDIRLMKSFRTEMTKCIWYYGKTGVGKSHKAFENFTPETHYNHIMTDKGWWDGYQQQHTVILNDFRGKITYDELLNLVDKWPYSVPRRGRAPIPFTSKMIIITSPLTPEQVYVNRDKKDSLDQLLRRIEVICLD